MRFARAASAPFFHQSLMTTLPLHHSVARQMDTAMQDDNEVSAELADDFWASPDIVTTDLTPSRLETFEEVWLANAGSLTLKAVCGGYDLEMSQALGASIVGCIREVIGNDAIETALIELLPLKAGFPRTRQVVLTVKPSLDIVRKLLSTVVRGPHQVILPIRVLDHPALVEGVHVRITGPSSSLITSVGLYNALTTHSELDGHFSGFNFGANEPVSNVFGADNVLAVTRLCTGGVAGRSTPANSFVVYIIPKESPPLAYRPAVVNRPMPHLAVPDLPFPYQRFFFGYPSTPNPCSACAVDDPLNQSRDRLLHLPGQPASSTVHGKLVFASVCKFYAHQRRIAHARRAVDTAEGPTSDDLPKRQKVNEPRIGCARLTRFVLAFTHYAADLYAHCLLHSELFAAPSLLHCVFSNLPSHLHTQGPITRFASLLCALNLTLRSISCLVLQPSFALCLCAISSHSRKFARRVRHTQRRRHSAAIRCAPKYRSCSRRFGTLPDATDLANSLHPRRCRPFSRHIVSTSLRAWFALACLAALPYPRPRVQPLAPPYSVHIISSGPTGPFCCSPPNTTGPHWEASPADAFAATYAYFFNAFAAVLLIGLLIMLGLLIVSIVVSTRYIYDFCLFPDARHAIRRWIRYTRISLSLAACSYLCCTCVLQFPLALRGWQSIPSPSNLITSILFSMLAFIFCLMLLYISAILCCVLRLLFLTPRPRLSGLGLPRFIMGCRLQRSRRPARARLLAPASIGCSPRFVPLHLRTYCRLLLLSTTPPGFLPLLAVLLLWLHRPCTLHWLRPSFFWAHFRRALSTNFCYHFPRLWNALFLLFLLSPLHIYCTQIIRSRVMLQQKLLRLASFAGIYLPHIACSCARALLLPPLLPSAPPFFPVSPRHADILLALVLTLAFALTVTHSLPAILQRLLLLLSCNAASLLNPGPIPQVPAPPEPPLLAMAWNVRGLSSRLDEVHTFLTQPLNFTPQGPPQTPDFLVLTETLLNGRLARKQSIRFCVEGRPEARHATAFYSHRTAQPSQRKHRRGVGILVKQCWAPFTSQAAITNPLLRGSLCVVDVRHGPVGPCFLRIVGVYLPTQSSAGSALRGLLTDFIKAEQEACVASATPYHLLLCGDINAALFPTDRPSQTLTAVDKHWGLFVGASSLGPLDTPLPGAAREHSYETNDASATSRIDDILCLPRTRACAAPLVSHVLRSDHTSDHHPVLAAFDLLSLGATRPNPSLIPPTPAPPPPAPHLPSSLTAEQLESIRLRVQRDCESAILDTHHFVQTSLQHGPTSPSSADSVISRLDGMITALHSRIFSIALDACGRTHWRKPRSTLPRRAQHQGFFPARVAKPMSEARNMATLCRQALGAARRPRNLTIPDPVPWHIAPEILALSAAAPALTPSAAELSASVPPVSWLSRVGRHKTAAARQARTLCRAHVSALHATESATLHAQLVRQPKRAHARILGTDAATPLVALRSSDPLHPHAPPVVIHEPAELLKNLAAQYHKTCAPVPTLFTPPPWTILGPPGSRPFHLRTARTTSHTLPPNITLFDLFDTTDGRVMFDSVLSDSRNKRAAGPDGIPNEVLKSLPHSYHDLLYDLFRLQLKLRRTLPSWKTSTTILIHKKGDATILSNFRPIGLANCAYKLWTACLTDLLGGFCETTGILSDGQAGFREDRRCLHQLLYLTSIIEDAHTFHRNLYVLYVDWANAFGSVDHSRLSFVLGLLGVPQDAIEVVGNLYSGASTRLRVPAGLTDPVAILRGTIQGDSLSPLLFLLYLEPLLQWLSVDADGYLPGCATDSAACSLPPLDRPERASYGAYADDLVLFSSTLPGLRRMVAKLDAYAAWSGMAVNAKKCAFSALVPHPPSLPTGGGRTKLMSPSQLRAHLTETAASISFNGASVAFLPANEPYRYLGIDIALSLSKRPNSDSLYSEVRRRIDLITSSALPKRDYRRVLLSLAASKIEYALPTGMLTKTCLRSLSSLLLRHHKDGLSLPLRCASECLTFPTAALGDGFPDLAHLSVVAACESIKLAYHDPGRLGRLCRALIATRYKMAGGCVSYLQSRARYKHTSLWHSRLAMAAEAGLLQDALLLPPPIDPQAHLLRVQDLLATTVPAPALTSTLDALFDLGIHHLFAIFSPSTLVVVTDGEFLTRFPRARAEHRKALATVRHWLAHEPAALQPLVQATLNPSPALAALYPPAGSRRQPAHSSQPTPAPTPLVGPSFDAIPRFSDSQTDAFYMSLAPSSHGNCRGHRFSPSGTAEYLLLCIVPTLDVVPFHFQSHFLFTPTQAESRWSSAHWCPATPFLLTLPALTAYHERCQAPPPLLGHPLPPSAGPGAGPLRICSQELNPDLDIHPTGAPQIHRFDDQYYVYDSAGRCAGLLTPDRLADLWRRFHAHSALCNFQVGSFLDELVLLLHRYRDGRKQTDGTKLQLKNHWAVPDSAFRALCALCSISCEMFASPLNVNAATTTYFSAHARDSVFGANVDAFASRWVGAVEFNPEYTPSDMLRSVQHALACARQTAPFLAVGVLPRWDTHPHYAQILRHPQCHVLAEVPRGLFNFTEAAYFPSDQPPGSHHAHWNVQFVLVANAGGLARFYKPAHAGAFHQTLASHAFSLRHPSAPPDPSSSEFAALLRKIKFSPPTAAMFSRAPPAETRWLRRLLAAMPSLPAAHSEPATGSSQRPSPPGPPLPFPTANSALPLRYDPQSFVYTDASLTRTTPGAPLGCGIHAPCDPATPDTCFVSNGTVTRGELLAIWWALVHACIESPTGPPVPLHILTDSLTSVFLIRKACFQPSSISEHAHVALLRAIAVAARSRRGPTSITKVRAHVGIRGNERADILAKEAAQGSAAAPLPLPQAVQAETDACSPVREAASWDSDRKLVLSHLQRRALSNPSNKTAGYLARTAGASLTTINQAASNHYLTSKGVGAAARNVNRQVRYRCNPCRLQRFLQDKHDKACPQSARTPDPLCLLCRAHIGTRPNLAPGCDSWTHTLGNGCLHPSIRRLVSLYHDKAVQLIVSCLQRRWKSGGAAILTDAPGPGGARTRTVPPQLLPGYAKRPDVMLITGWPAHELARSPPRFPPPGAASVVLIPLEFSFCHDHFIPDRVAEKRSKYADLIPRLRARGWTVHGVVQDSGKLTASGPHVLTVAVGHSGVLLAETKHQLIDLGLSPTVAQSLCCQLNDLSALKVLALTKAKTELEAKLVQRATAAGHTLRTNWGMNENRCDVCHGSGGDLFCCDACPRAFHSSCSCDGVELLPEAAPWSCPRCAPPHQLAQSMPMPPPLPPGPRSSLAPSHRANRRFSLLSLAVSAAPPCRATLSPEVRPPKRRRTGRFTFVFGDDNDHG